MKSVKDIAAELEIKSRDIWNALYAGRIKCEGHRDTRKVLFDDENATKIKDYFLNVKKPITRRSPRPTTFGFSK